MTKTCTLHQLLIGFTAAATAGWLFVHGAAAGDYVAEVQRDAPIAWWRFQDPTTAAETTVADQTRQHPGASHGKVTREPGPAAIGGSAAGFDGQEAFVEVPHSAAFDRTAISVEFWFKSLQPWQDLQWPGSATIITKATAGAASSDWTINAASTRPGENEGRIVASGGPRGESSDVNTTSSGKLNDDRWHHVVWTRSDDGVNQLFVDGRLADETEDNAGLIINERPIQIGGDPHQHGRFYCGAIAEVAIYGTALTPERVQAHAVAGGLDVAPATARQSLPRSVDSLTLVNDAGMVWELACTERGWALGQIRLHDTPLEAVATAGILCLRHTQSGEARWLAGQTAERIGTRAARVTGAAEIDGVPVRFHCEITLEPDSAAAHWTTDLTVEQQLAGWEACFAPWAQSTNRWRCWCYPFAGNSKAVSIAPLRYCGVPAVLAYRPDLSMITLFGIDTASDYLNPHTWTGETAFHFQSRRTPPEFRFGGGDLSPAEHYRAELQILVSDAGSFAPAVTQLVRSWIALNHYRVEPLEVCEPAEAAAIFVTGRRASQLWQSRKGYQIQDAWPVIYMPESPINAYLDYVLYEQTGDDLWRDRAFQIMEFVKLAQHLDPAAPNYGAIESHYNLREEEFASTDRGGNPGLKPDMNAYAARYTLMLWQRVKQHEGLDRRDWYDLGVRIAQWVVRQQRADGGLPQVVGPDEARNAVSVVSGRALVALPVVRRITGDAQYDPFLERHEQFVRRQVEHRFWFTGAHTDLPPQDFESDSVWQVVEYWLDKYDQTRAPDDLSHAEANALLGFLMMCPKQLSWVANPTQTCHAEQQHYLQYSNYCYNNAKIVCLHRLAELTGQGLYRQLCDRVMQCGYWSQERTGPWMGSVYERMSDPWLGVSQDVNSKGTRYMSELAVEFNLQLLQMDMFPLHSPDYQNTQ
jgi:hypothetical protein